jgi:hypothetical protein
VEKARQKLLHSLLCRQSQPLGGQTAEFIESSVSAFYVSIILFTQLPGLPGGRVGL